MEELLLPLLLAIAEIFAEAFHELAGEALIDLIGRAVVKVFTTKSDANPALVVAEYTILGALAGSASLFIFPHPLVHPSRFHGISWLISPLLVGLMMSLIGAWLKKQDKRIAQDVWLWIRLGLWNGGDTVRLRKVRFPTQSRGRGRPRHILMFLQVFPAAVQMGGGVGVDVVILHNAD